MNAEKHISPEERAILEPYGIDVTIETFDNTPSKILTLIIQKRISKSIKSTVGRYDVRSLYVWLIGYAIQQLRSIESNSAPIKKLTYPMKPLTEKEQKEWFS